MSCGKVVPRTCCFMLFLSMSFRATASSFEGLSFVSGGKPFSDARAVSSDGNAVAGTAKTASGATEAFYWTPAGGMIGLSHLLGGTMSQGKGISADGTVVVGFGDVPGSPFPPYKGFAWRSDTGMISLSDFNSVQSQSTAIGANSNGTIVVGQANGPGGTRAAYWATGTATLTGLDDMTVVKPTSLANAITPDGSVIVGSGLAPLGTEAFRWTTAAGMVPLGDLDGGKHESVAFAVATDGGTVVGYANDAAGQVPMRWTAAIGMQALGPDAIAVGGQALGISADGRFIVGKAPALGGAFIWDELHGMRSLKSVLTDDYGLGVQLSTWTLDTAYAITPDGTTIVGTGHDPAGNTEAWRAVIPEPSMLLVIILLAALALVRRRPRTIPLTA